MADDTKSETNRVIATMTVFYTLCGIPFGAFGPLGMEALHHLVTVQLSHSEGGGGPLTGPCGEQAPGSAGGAGPGDGNSTALVEEIQSRTILVTVAGSVVGGLLSALVSLFASSRLDSGRADIRLMAMLPSAAFAAGLAMYALLLGLGLPFWTFVLPMLVLGLGGSIFLQGAVALVYLGSATSEAGRSRAFLIVQTGNLAGQGVANIGIGYLAEGVGMTLAYVFLVLVSIATVAFVFLFFPDIEQVKGDRDGDRDGEGDGDGEQPDQGRPRAGEYLLAVVRDPTSRAWNWDVIISAAAFFAYVAVAAFLMSMLQIVVLGPPFCWSPSLIGYFGATKLTGVVIGQSITAAFLRRWLDDYPLVQLGFLSVCISSIIPAYARTNGQLFLVTVFGAFRFIPGAALTSRVSKLVGEARHGSLFGVTNSIESMAACLGPVLFGSVYSATLKSNPAFVFQLMAGMTAIPSVLVMILQIRSWTSAAKDTNGETAGSPLLPPPPKP